MVDRRLFLKLLGAGTGSAALATIGNPFLMPTVAQATVRSDTADAAIAEFIANPPFSFNYAGQSSASLLPQWPTVRRRISSSPGRSEELVTWRAPSGELQVQAAIVVYENYAATEWTVSFANLSSDTSQRLSAVMAADTIINRSPTAPYALHHFNGSSQQADDYAPQTSLLAPGKAQLLFPVGGRPSNGTWPYFNVSWKDRGSWSPSDGRGNGPPNCWSTSMKVCASRPG